MSAPSILRRVEALGILAVLALLAAPSLLAMSATKVAMTYALGLAAGLVVAQALAWPAPRKDAVLFALIGLDAILFALVGLAATTLPWLVPPYGMAQAPVFLAHTLPGVLMLGIAAWLIARRSPRAGGRPDPSARSIDGKT